MFKDIGNLIRKIWEKYAIIIVAGILFIFLTLFIYIFVINWSNLQEILFVIFFSIFWSLTMILYNKYYIKIHFNIEYLKDKIYQKTTKTIYELYFGVLKICLGLFIITYIYIFLNEGNFTFIGVKNTFIFLSKYYKTEFYAVILFLVALFNIRSVIKCYNYYILNISFFIINGLALVILTSFPNISGNNYIAVFLVLHLLFLSFYGIGYLIFEEHKNKGSTDIEKSYKATSGKNTKEHYTNFKKKLNEFKKLQKGANEITPIYDIPLNGTHDKDILGNGNFTQNIFNLINGLDTKRDSYSIGIVGKWGDGKTSILNMLEQKYLYGNPNYILYKFNPWNFTKENIIEIFFSDFGKTLKENGIRIGNLLGIYIKFLSKVTIKTTLGLNFSLSNSGKSLEQIKNKISGKLKDIDRKIIIYVDDLDRCEPDEVVLILNLIKNLGDFENIIYVVSYDKEHIQQSLKEKNFNIDYLDKIINLERYLPIPNSETLKEYFFSELEKIFDRVEKLNKERIKQIEKDNNQEPKKSNLNFLNILTELKENNGIKEIFEIENLRFIKKLLNNLNIILQVHHSKIPNDTLEEKNIEFFRELIIINYWKIKNYSWFSELLHLWNTHTEWLNNQNDSTNNIFKEYFDGHFSVLKQYLVNDIMFQVYNYDKTGVKVEGIISKSYTFILLNTFH